MTLRFTGLAILATLACACGVQHKPVVVGSKAFTEGYLIGELVAQTLEDGDATVSRRLGMGATGILYQAIISGDIEMYPEYTGTIAESILQRPDLKSFAEIQNALAPLGLAMSPPLGFSNTYALAVTREAAKEHRLKTLSDLARAAPRLRAGFSHEFVNRTDGLKSLAATYGINFMGPIHSMQHTLAYEAVSNRVVDVIDVYTTDAKIKTLDLVVLEDDQKFFPVYEAVILVRRDFIENNGSLWEKIQGLAGTIDEATMRNLNAGVDLNQKSFARVISEYRGRAAAAGIEGADSRILKRTKEHFVLVTVALLLAVFTGLPLGILAVKNPVLGQFILALSSLIQTVPSLALLCFLIPIFGIGNTPALVALYLYALLPLVLNTFTGIRAIDPRLTEVALALGLSAWRRLIHIELPLASMSILAGIRTSAIITIGTATLAALIGAGGYGVPIVSGLATNNLKLILTGAIPAAAMALLAYGLFELLERALVPKGLRG